MMEERKEEKPEVETMDENSEEDFFRTIVFGEEEKDLMRALHLLNQYIKDNKPAIKVISAEFQAHFEELYDSAVKKGENGFLQLSKRVIYLFQKIKKKCSHRGIYLAIFACLEDIKALEESQAKEKFEENFLPCRLHAKESWISIDPKVIQEFVSFFRVDEMVEPNEFAKLIEPELSTNMLEAIKFISKLNLQKFFPVKEILTKLVNQDKITESAEFVEDCGPEAKTLFIDLLTNNKNASRGADYVKKFGFSIEQFPNLRERLEKNHVRYIVKSSEYNLNIIEERLVNEKRLLGFAVEDLFYAGKQDEACSLCQRNDLLENGFIKKADILEQMKAKLLDFQYKENALFKKDGFGPTEVQVLGQSEDVYILLKDFGIKESDVEFIATDDSLEFDRASKALLSSKIIGLDTEFVPTYTKFDIGGVAIFQIATESKVFIFDVMAMSNSLKLPTLLLAILTGPAIKVVKNFFEIQEIDQNISKSPHIQGLATISENLLKKKLSKYEQISNWGKRPLRKTQLHYAAMDALICIILFRKMEAMTNLENFERSFVLNYDSGNKPEKEEKESEQIEKPGAKNAGPKKKAEKKADSQKPKETAANKNEKKEGFYVSETYKYISEKRPLKFLVDNMLKSLASTLRNLGVDAEYVDIKDHEHLIGISKEEERVIITRDKKFVARNHGMPTYFLQENDPNAQRERILDFFRIQIHEHHLLSRCSKCNNDQIVLVSKEKAKADGLNWREDYFEKINEIFQCTKCKQFYWEGNTWKNAVKNYTEIADKLEKKMASEDDK